MKNKYRNSRIVLNVAAIVAVLSFFTACDEIEGPYKQPNSGSDKTLLNKRKIVLEEYTGFTCGNCPKATKLAHELEAASDHQVILLSVHAGGYATPASKGLYTYDFRSPEGDELFSTFGISYNPAGLVSRADFSGGRVSGKETWAARIDELKNTEPKMLIRLLPEYNTITRGLYLDVEISYLSQGDSTHNLVLYLLEDKIIKPQTDYTFTDDPDIEEYEHNNVLRGSITGTWGKQLSPGNIPSGYTIRREYYYTLPEGKDWKPENMNILAFVQKLDPKNDIYEIYQAEEVELIK